MPTCKLTGKPFEVSDFEKKLRTDFDLPDATTLPHLRIRHLGAFWPHWNLHKRKCDKTGKDIISVFRPDCPYPVWHKDEWYKSAEPPKAIFDFNEKFFPQAEKLFKQCPIPHNSGLNNENCEFTDDWWNSKNCYLSHSGVNCEEDRYSYRILGCKNSLFSVFSFECELCSDVINSEKCHQCIYGLYLKNCRDCVFSYDCRNCASCLFCFNLRNKQYCIGNKQLTKEEYEKQSKEFAWNTIRGYEHCKEIFQKMMRDIAWHKSHYLDFAEKSEGNYALQLKNVAGVFFGNGVEDGVNTVRLGWAKTLVDTINIQDAEKVIYSSGVQIKCYEVANSFMVDNARFTLYSGYSSRCENIFGCCGLLNGKYAILNTLYGQHEYTELKQKIIDHMRSTGEWGEFFPGSFAPNPYEESWSSFYFPLDQEEQKNLGFFHLPHTEKHNTNYKGMSEIPQSANEADETVTKETYWDEIAHKPFQILPQDINLCRELSVPLPNSHYMRHIQENFRWMPYNGTLRKTTCAKSGVEIETGWPKEFDGRILSELEYTKLVQ